MRTVTLATTAGLALAAAAAPMQAVADVLTELQLFSLYNNLCLSAVVVISWLVSRRYPSPFFRSWLLASALNIAISYAELYASFVQRTLGLDLLEFWLAVGTAWFLCRAAGDVDPAVRPGRKFATFLALLAGSATVARLAGVPYEQACLPPVLAFVLSFGWLGFRLVRAGEGQRGRALSLLGWPLIGFALSVLTYPVLQHSRWFWLGFIVTGALQFAAGCGMVVFAMRESWEELQEQNERLRHLDRLKDQLLSNVSHELRTPITAIKTASFMATARGAEPLSNEQAELMGIIAASSEQLGRLVTDMIDYSKMEAGVMGYERVATDLPRLVAGAVRAIRPRFAERKLALVVDAGPPGLLAVIDPVRVTQLLHNLLGNALKFTPVPGEVRVEVSDVDGEVELAVIDTGIGIAEADLPRVFERFYQTDASATRRVDGMGLGLAIVKAIVEEGHQGTLSVFSTPGQGSRFTVRLPKGPAAGA